MFPSFNLRKIPKEKVYGNILDSKKAFLDWKNKELKKSNS